MGYNLLINGVYSGYNPLANLILTSWDIQVWPRGPFKRDAPSKAKQFPLWQQHESHPTQGHNWQGMNLYTLPETNIAPENGWLEDEFPFGMAQFQGLC